MQGIILAAGLGSRLRPLTLTTPKPLLPVGGTPLIERNIGFLKEAGVENIVVVTGHLSEEFNYLSEKYGVKLVFNKDYKRYNNVYSLATALPEFDSTKGCFILEGDGYFKYNIFREFLEEGLREKRLNQNSVYFARYLDAPHNEWQLNTGTGSSKGRVIEIEVSNDGSKGNGGYVISTACYLSAHDFATLATLLPNYLNKPKFYNYFYDDVISENILSFDIKIYAPRNNDDIIEIDTLEDYERLGHCIKS